jgi:hypothetical protein
MCSFFSILLVLLLAAPAFGETIFRPRVIVSTDIGGTDPDDFQSMIHYLMYADRFQTEGLVSSPYGEGRKEHILQIINLYEKDYPKLKPHSKHFPTANALRSVTKQGATERAPAKGWSAPSEGSQWIIECARRKHAQPLWILVWGGLEDVAQALHDAPDILDKLRVYWIAGPNKKWGADVYQYVARNFPDLWMIETNATYRGWFTDATPESDLGSKGFYERHINGRGAMGRDFGNYYGGEIKMGDTPSVAYLLHGNPEKPGAPSWGGSFVPLRHSSRRIFHRETTLDDQVPVFALLEWVLKGPDTGAASDEPVLWLEVSGQRFEGFYEGSGRYIARFVPKAVGNWSYRISSPITELDGLEGQFTSVDGWPGKPHQEDIAPLKRWWSDSQDPDLYMGPHQGAKTVGLWREAFLLDWAKRWDWLAEK